MKSSGLMRLLVVAVLGLALCGCATLRDDESPPAYTTALQPGPAPTTTLDRLAQSSMAGAPAGESGFRHLFGPGGLDARLALLRGAGRSLDLQYYHLHDDATGRLMLRELRNAAQRGVRVRLLLDDLYTDGLEPLLDGLGAYPNVEVRLFNPFPTRGSVGKRFAAALMDFARVNRRMHNKLFLADGVAAIAGGRNLGDEYFARGRLVNFFDYEVLALGPVVPQMASLFDEYWNAPQVRTAVSVLRPTNAPEVLRNAFDARVDGADTPDVPGYRGPDALGRTALVDEVIAGRLKLVNGRAQAFADSPAKAWGQLETARLPSGALLDSSRRLLTSEFLAARQEAWIATPYLVPGPAALEAMRERGRNGVKVHLLTNSLAATDEPLVHTGYRRYRDNMLRAGVEIHEMHPALGQRFLQGSGVAPVQMRLHTKTAIVDRRKMFVGSVNFDPRSELLNTEFGILIESPALAEEAHGLLVLLARETAYQVRLKEGTERDLQWRRVDPQQGEEIIESEPGADLWTRVKLYIQSILIPESML